MSEQREYQQASESLEIIVNSSPPNLSVGEMNSHFIYSSESGIFAFSDTQQEFGKTNHIQSSLNYLSTFLEIYFSASLVNKNSYSQKT
jgi:hypothetical protein